MKRYIADDIVEHQAAVYDALAADTTNPFPLLQALPRAPYETDGDFAAATADRTGTDSPSTIKDIVRPAAAADLYRNGRTHDILEYEPTDEADWLATRAAWAAEPGDGHRFARLFDTVTGPHQVDGADRVAAITDYALGPHAGDHTVLEDAFGAKALDRLEQDAADHDYSVIDLVADHYRWHRGTATEEAFMAADHSITGAGFRGSLNQVFADRYGGPRSYPLDPDDA